MSPNGQRLAATERENLDSSPRKRQKEAIFFIKGIIAGMVGIPEPDDRSIETT
jgi:hypothetical protein